MAEKSPAQGTGIETRSLPDCEHCDAGHVDGIQDVFRGPLSELDNADDVRDVLADRGALSPVSSLALRGLERADTRRDIAKLAALEGSRDTDGPYVTESIVTSERWCTNDDCDFSERCFYPV